MIEEAESRHWQDAC